jgi:hypothetical protein
MDTKIFREWPFWVMVGLFILSVILMVQDPLGLDSQGEQSTSAIKVLYFLLPLAAIFWLFVRPTIKK